MVICGMPSLAVGWKRRVRLLELQERIVTTYG
jgi:hypothetical protein